MNNPKKLLLLFQILLSYISHKCLLFLTVTFYAHWSPFQAVAGKIYFLRLASLITESNGLEL